MRWTVVPVVLALLLAGCSGDDDPDPGTTNTGTTTTSTTTSTGTTGTTPRDPVTEVPLLLGFGMEGCQGTTVSHITDATAVQALLPDGITAAPAFAGAPAGTATVVVEAWSCTNLTVAATGYGPVDYGRVYTFIAEPTDLFPDRDLAADAQVYTFQVLTGFDLGLQLWPVAGYDTYAGLAGRNFTATPVLTQVAQTLGDYSWDGAGATGATGASSGLWRQYTLLDNGDWLLWSGNESYSPSIEGFGSITVPSETPFTGLGPGGSDQLPGALVYTEDRQFADHRLIKVLAEPI